ncbi:MAG: hypothetical protein HYT12_01315 [Candidatus Liptonbacteria bacterium]|nr:hypothetical protein [Candidatus Liptonbacteria bacterium]
MTTIRQFLGSRDIQQIALHLVFPSSNIVVVSAVDAEERWPLVVEGPEHHINFLKPLMLKMVKMSPMPGEEGSWAGVDHKNSNRLDLFYKYGASIKDRIELLQGKFRYDVVKYADLRISEISVLEIIRDDEQIFEERITLPRGFKNGSIMLPALWLH